MRVRSAAQHTHSPWAKWKRHRHLHCAICSPRLPPRQCHIYLHDDDDGTDFERYENKNVAADPQYAAVVKELFAVAKAQWDQVPPAPSPHCSAVMQGDVKKAVEFLGGTEGLPLTHSPATSVADCYQQCGAAVKCSHFTFSVDDGMCRFHTSLADLRNSSAYDVSGALDGAPPLPQPLPPAPPGPAPKPPRPTPGCAMESGACYDGHILGYIPASSATTCCTACGEVDGCAAFTFTPELLRCSCLSNVTYAAGDTDSISGNITGVNTRFR